MNCNIALAVVCLKPKPFELTTSQRQEWLGELMLDAKALSFATGGRNGVDARFLAQSF